jgi:hypothetical protein
MFSFLLPLYLMSQPAQPAKSNEMAALFGLVAVVGGIYLWDKNNQPKTSDLDRTAQSKEIKQPEAVPSPVEKEFKREERIENKLPEVVQNIEEENDSEGISSNVPEMLLRLSTEDGSIAVCGDPGTGKSTVVKYLIKNIRESSSDAVIKVLAAKNDSFGGLRELGCVTQFDNDCIGEAIALFREVEDEYKRRTKLKEGERDGLPPYVIILDDWISISFKLNKFIRLSRLNKKPRSLEDIYAEPELEIDFGSILYDILSIGREFNMKFIVNLHSLNLKAIGVDSMDSNSRAMLKIICLGNRYIKYGRELNAYGIIEKAIMGIQVIADGELRDTIRTQYYARKKESQMEQRPVAFAYAGEYFVGLVPKFEGELSVELPASEPLPAIEPEPEPEPEPLEPDEVLLELEPMLITSEERCLVVHRRREGKNKKDIIFEVWGAKKGGGKKYKEAEAKYEEVVKSLQINRDNP